MIHLLFHVGKKIIEWIVETVIEKVWKRKKALQIKQEADDQNKSWCGAIMKTGNGGSYYCNEEKGHTGSHMVGEVIWDNK